MCYTNCIVLCGFTIFERICVTSLLSAMWCYRLGHSEDGADDVNGGVSVVPQAREALECFLEILCVCVCVCVCVCACVCVCVCVCE
jgi:hypothetical protein